MSLTTITFGCDSVELNDYLEPFVLPNIPDISTNRSSAQCGNYGRVPTGIDHRTSFGRRDYFIVDRGSNHGVTVGAQFVVYRDKRQPDTFLFPIRAWRSGGSGSPAGDIHPAGPRRVHVR